MEFGKELDKVVENHHPEHLQELFSAIHVAELPFFSILVKPTAIPWILFIPKAPLTNTSAMLMLNGQILKIANGLQAQGRGHYNFAKIGNKSEWLHFHLVFRNENDEAWPDPIWCHEPLSENERMAQALVKQIKTVLQDGDDTGI